MVLTTHFWQNSGSLNVRFTMIMPVIIKSSSYHGWWLTYPSEKYERQMGSLFPIYGKITTNRSPTSIKWDHYSQYMEK